MSYGQMKHSLALVGNHLEMVSRQKYRRLHNLKFTRPLMREMSNQNSENNSVNRAGPVGEGSSPGRCSLVRQQRPGHHPTTLDFFYKQLRILSRTWVA